MFSGKLLRVFQKSPLSEFSELELRLLKSQVAGVVELDRCHVRKVGFAITSICTSL